jgi:DNA-binding transcriptional ArsR family regulator
VSSASAHLNRLVDGGLLTVQQSGRHRYYRIADQRAATGLEVLASLAPPLPIRSLRQSTRAAALRQARTC